MSEVDLALAFLSGVVMGMVLDRWLLPPVVDAWIDRRNPAVPDQLREEALREILGQIDVDGAKIVAVHPAPSENARLLGLVAVREQRLTVQPQVGRKRQ